METDPPYRTTRRNVRGVPLDERVDLAYRLASMARNEAEMLPQYAEATPEAIDAAVVHALRMALNVAEGREPWEARPPGKAPGGDVIDWKALTGWGIDDLVYYVRIRMVEVAKIKREHKLCGGPKPPHSGSRLQTCKQVLGDVLGEDMETDRVREYASQLVPIIKRRDSEIGWKMPDKNVLGPFMELVGIDVSVCATEAGGPDLFELTPEIVGRRLAHKKTPLPRSVETKAGN